MDRKILPLGTVVRVKDKKERYVIVGRHVKNNNTNYDYACLIYPYGYYDFAEFLYINDDQVTSMYYLGDINY